MQKNEQLILDYCQDVMSGKRLVNIEQKQGVERYLKTLKNKDCDFRPIEAEKIIGIIEKTFCHRQGEAMDLSLIHI